jgi:uncharacterized protein (DUF1499 family)
MTTIGVLALLLFGLGPAGATLGVLAPMVGFAMFALGGILGLLVLVWGGLRAVRGKGGWLGAALGLAVTGVFLSVALPGRSYPPYNDFTTDVGDPPAFVQAGNLPGNRGRDMSYPGGKVTEAQRAAYPDLRPLDLDVPPAEAFALVRDRARQVRGWTIGFEDASSGIVEGVATSAVFQFQDDFVIRVRRRAGGSRIDMRSKSRDGRGDIGANAQRIRDFFATLQPPP